MVPIHYYLLISRSLKKQLYEFIYNLNDKNWNKNLKQLLEIIRCIGHINKFINNIKMFEKLQKPFKSILVNS